jgi:hypothetical protein
LADCFSDNWGKFPDFVVIMDGMKYRKHDVINPIPQRKNCYIHFGANGSVERCWKMSWRREKRRRLRAGATPIHKQAIDENLPIQPPSIDQRSQAEASMPSRPNLR